MKLALYFHHSRSHATHCDGSSDAYSLYFDVSYTSGTSRVPAALASERRARDLCGTLRRPHAVGTCVQVNVKAHPKISQPTQTRARNVSSQTCEPLRGLRATPYPQTGGIWSPSSATVRFVQRRRPLLIPYVQARPLPFPA